MKSIKITEKTWWDDIPYTMILIRMDERNNYYKFGDVKIKISGLSGDFRLTPSQQEKIINFLREA